MLAHYAQDYPALVDNLLLTLPEDEAMARAVGSNRDNFLTLGLLERQILTQFGFSDVDVVVDVGCGSGRLASALVDSHRGMYVGFDIVEKLVEYADRNYGGDNFRFFTCDGLTLPLDPSVADYMAFFSVFTHLNHEETFIYLEDAYRILRPGGTLVCSYLDVEQNWEVFEATAEACRTNTAPHANVFMSRETVEYIVSKAGFEVVSTFRPNDRFISFASEVPIENEANLAAGTYQFGQGVCVAQKGSDPFGV